MPRCWATAATPAVRQLARPESTISTGVGALSSAAKTSGWSASTVKVRPRCCSSPRPKKPSTVERLWVPFSHSQLARHLNWAASGAASRALRASMRASVLTPLSTLPVWVAWVMSCSFPGVRGFRLIAEMRRSPAAYVRGVGPRGTCRAASGSPTPARLVSGAAGPSRRSGPAAGGLSSWSRQGGHGALRGRSDGSTLGFPCCNRCSLPSLVAKMGVLCISSMSVRREKCFNCIVGEQIPPPGRAWGARSPPSRCWPSSAGTARRPRRGPSDAGSAAEIRRRGRGPACGRPWRRAPTPACRRPSGRTPGLRNRRPWERRRP